MIRKLVILMCALLCASVYARDKPNIIIVLVDDMGYSDVGAFGGEVETPNIDALAKNGLRFTQNYNSARCCPSRATLLTGLYSHQAGIADFTSGDQTATRGPAYLGYLNDQCVTLADVLKSDGYSTYGVGKWHVGGNEAASPTNRGFDEYYGYADFHGKNQWMYKENVKGGYYRLPEGRKPELTYTKDTFYATDVFTDYALEFIKQGTERKKPFFLYLAHSSPHFPIQAPAATRDKYLERYRKGWDVLRKERFERQKKIGLLTDAWEFTERSLVPMDPKGKMGPIDDGYGGQKNPAWDSLDGDRQEDLAYRMALFAAMIDHVDQGIGRIIKQLKENGQFENSLILFTSDNGACYEWGPYGFDGGSRQGLNVLHKGEDLNKMGLAGGKEMSVGSAWSCLSNTPLRMYKHFNHEGGNCSPLIVHWPKGIGKADRWVRTPVHLMDYMPTLCDVAGAKYPEKFNGNQITPSEGVSMKPVFDGDDKLPERTIFFDHFQSSAIRKGGWKLVRGNNRYKKRTWELYNIDEDRCETRDLINDEPEKAKALEAEWEIWAKSVKVFPYYRHQQNR